MAENIQAHPSNTGDHDAPIVTLTEKAIEQLKATMQRDGTTDQGLRVGVEGGGCSGMQYVLGFEPQPRTDDTVLDVAGIRIFVDPASRQHLQGVTIDYVMALHGAGFKFVNPNASRTCGCGSSFAA